MAALLFSTQRAQDGSAIFSKQVDVAEPEFFATIVSASSLTAFLALSTLSLSASLTTLSTLVAPLSFDRFPLGAQLSSTSTLSAQLQPSTNINIQTFLGTQSELVARLYFSTGSSIPKGVRVRATPSGEDSTQIVRYRGDTYADSFTVFNEKTGEFIDVSGCTFKLSVASGSKCSPNRQILHTLYGLLDDAENGQISFAPTESQANLVGFFFYDVEMRDSQGVVRTLISDSYVYKQDITP